MSKLTLDEAIKHCAEVAEQNETKALRIGRQYKGTLLNRDAKECRECAADYRRLAEWLRELQEWRTNPFKMIRRTCVEEKQKSNSCASCPWNDRCLTSPWHLSPAMWEVNHEQRDII